MIWICHRRIFLCEQNRCSHFSKSFEMICNSMLYIKMVSIEGKYAFLCHTVMRVYAHGNANFMRAIMNKYFIEFCNFQNRKQKEKTIDDYCIMVKEIQIFFCFSCLVFKSVWVFSNLFEISCISIWCKKERNRWYTTLSLVIIIDSFGDEACKSLCFFLSHPLIKFNNRNFTTHSFISDAVA